MLKIILLTHNNQDLITETLESVVLLKGNIIIGDFDSTDKTIDICKKFRANVIKTTIKNRAKACNELIKNLNNDWILYLHPGEILIQGHELIAETISGENKAYHISILQNDVINKQIRLWNKSTNIQFKNFVFETLSGGSSDPLDVVLYSKNKQYNKRYLKSLEEWKKQDLLAPEPFYYKALIELGEHNFQDFRLSAKQYLFRNKSENIASIMTRYYLAMLEWVQDKNFNEALKNLTFCLANNPLMAEFWCLLGDIFADCREIKKAICFYENAIILGSRRLKEDIWPIQISKYETYPNEMIKKCQLLLEKSQEFRVSGLKL